MDGRVQLPVIKYLQEYFNAEYVDSITEAGPVRILAEQENNAQIKSILQRLNISVESHQSVGIAIVAHDDCAGSPFPKEKQITQLKEAVCIIREKYVHLEIIGLWVDYNWHVHKVQ
jgi:hypothetical protein